MLKEKYEYIMNEKLTIYNKVIKEILNINDILLQYKNFITQKLK